MIIGTDEANPDPDPPCDPSGGGLNRSAISNTNDDGNNEDNSDGDKRGDEDEDADAIDGPTVDAYINLMKRKCKYYFTGYSLIHILTYIYSAQSVS